MVRRRRSYDITKYCHFYEDHGHGTNQCREPRHQIKEAVRSGQLAHLMKGINKGKVKAPDTQLGEGKKRDKDTIPAKSLILIISRESPISKRKSLEEPIDGIGEIIEVPLEVTIGENPYKRTETLNFVIVRIGTVSSSYESNKVKEGHNKIKETIPEAKRGVLSCVDVEEKVIVNDKYLEQTVTIGISRTIMVGGRTFNTEHKLNEYKHIKPIKRKKRELGCDRNEAIDWKVESLSGFQLKCFLNAYKGYHQIQMAEVDEDKMEFFTGKTHGIFPTLTALIKGEVLIMYLAASTESISVVLLAEREKRLVPIYFISTVLQGEELNYLGLEKLILALVHAARRLRRSTNSRRDGNQKPTYLRRLLADSQPSKGNFRSHTTCNKAISRKAEGNFDPYLMEHIRINQNMKADALSKLAYMTFEHLTKEVLVEVLAKISIKNKEVSMIAAEAEES
ncbi:reverse transcriptase domain-containing protein [Tanacetum coccineum]